MTNDNKGRFDVCCAWCAKEGKRTVVGTSTVENSHGICREHKRQLMGGIKRKK